MQLWKIKVVSCLLPFLRQLLQSLIVMTKKSSSTINSRSYSNSSSSYSSSNGSTYHATETKPREKTDAERLLEVYEGNSLSNGSQPYSSVYGTNSTFRGYIITTFVR